MTNILHIYKDYHPVKGGMENMIKWLAEAQVQAGHHVTVLVASLDQHERIELFNGVNLHKVPRWATLASTPITPTLPWAIWQYQPDIAHIHSPYPPGELFNMLVGRARFTVITYQSDVVRQKTILKFYKPFLQLALRRADIIMPSSANYIEISPFLRPHRHKCRVVSPGIDLARFNIPTLPLTSQLKAKFGSPLLLFVGRLRYYKGLDTLIEAMRDVPKAKLIIVGDGQLRAELENQTHALNLDKQIHFAGDVSDADLPAYFQAADAFVLPSNSRAEAFGIVLLEAMASGLPCISTELGTGTSWIVQHGVTGFVVPPQNPPAMAQAINKLINDEPLRRQFAQAAVARVRAEFSKELMVQRVQEVYNELLTKHI